ncbi:hypothetical protein CFOL_v3_07080 [Cephalotus follicularis]|uniref:UVR domain-containing protein n=1 Tax=Cephalotus follicularis TaxID=3775 RepID=A0A1Q3B6Z1_CEPFO|nr:hypothetical protein CFOL_v3_07080 [Cephalotus follicularis]
MAMKEEDDIDSLFEGMVLFTPSSQLAEEAGDENLFSDLTLNSQTLEETHQSDHTILITSSNTSRRKKRASSSLRIGYGRGESTDDHDRSVSSSSSSSNLYDDDNNNNRSIYQSPYSSSTPNPMHEFEVAKSQISHKLNLARQLAKSVSGARKDSMARRRKAAEDVHVASLKLSHLEKQLDDACESEDFEAAETISQSLASAEKEKQASLVALRDTESLCDAFHSDMIQAIHSQIAAEDHSASLLHQLATDALCDAELVLKKAQALSSQHMDSWFSSSEALEAKKMEFQIHSHLVNDALNQLHDSIDHAIQDDIHHKDSLCKRKDMLNDELHRLIDLVKEKEKEIAENDSEIQAVEERIARVVSGFRETQSTINTKYDDLQSALSQLELESKTLAEKKKEIDNLLTEEEDRGAKLRELARISSDEATTYQKVVGLRRSLMSSIIKSTEDKARLAKTEELLSEDVHRLKQEVCATRASLQELSSTKSSIQQNIETLKQRIFFIDKRVPELEAEKKVAAAARYFKEAARIAAEAKSLSVEKNGVQIEMDKAVLELKELEEEIKDTVNRLQETDGLILSIEKEVAMARFQRLHLIAGSAKAERSAALELGDLEEANILFAEAEAAESEARKLPPDYNLKEEEFSNLPKRFISIDLIANLGLKELADLAASVHLSAI